MRKLFQDSAIIVLAVLLTGGTAFAMQPAATNQVHAESHSVANVEPPIKADTVKVESTPVPEKQDAPAALETVKSEPTPVPATPAPVPQDNETIVWNYLIAHGFTRNQTAGIMGNLQQEHNFNTDGDGLAQWTGGRKANLMSRANPYDINTQLDFLIYEFKSNEIAAYTSILNYDTVESATISFQNQFERCNPAYCMQSQRIAYAYAILQRH